MAGTSAPGWGKPHAAGDGSTPMCFSSSASFVVAAVLLPLGVASVRYCQAQQRSDLLPLALTPVFFSVQQALEGLVWLGLEPGGAAWLVHPAALGYLFFAYAFWLAWLPWCGLRLGVHAPPPLRRWVLRSLLVLGLLAGAGLWLPLLIDGSLFQPAVVQGSLDYHTTLLADRWINLGFGSTVYGLIIAMPLMISASVRLRLFGGCLLVAFLISHLAYGYAFTSVWCFFSAVLSASLPWILSDPQPLVIPARSRWDLQVPSRFASGPPGQT
ncbi:hypothetical protein KBY66_12900 [Synechococcus sp. Tobar12-5m-g]|uniref:DUF6629 family protein n=1 Tax=unclassified Synechococcus TaxID=2626047 RepID=UPI0020CF9DB5|nr:MULTISPECIES: DUF6629 family protein [unclassified Synechococcus]MCP9773502.1 hypothetical protein [Synechococcus sp. Tobar12-5m-g]MCP9874440.1 hypothetical protein [Synechococcus sp. Cruz CV-v-12]